MLLLGDVLTERDPHLSRQGAIVPRRQLLDRGTQRSLDPGREVARTDRPLGVAGILVQRLSARRRRTSGPARVQHDLLFPPLVTHLTDGFKLFARGQEDRNSPGWTRTNNPPVNSRMLCQLSYRGRQRGQV